MGRGIFNKNNFIKTVRYLHKNGVRHTYYAAKERISEEGKASYHYVQPTEDTLERQRNESGSFHTVFSIVVPAYETKERFLKEMIDSVLRQSYDKWELIIADAGSNDSIEKIVQEISPQISSRAVCGGRIKYTHLVENRGIAENTNAGIALATGDYIALLDHDDFLAPDALYHMAAAVDHVEQQGVKPVLLYTDEDKYDDAEQRYFAPHIKQKFNMDLILSNNYICHFMAVEACMFKEMGLRSEYDGAQDYDLVLRVIERLCEEQEAQEQEAQEQVAQKQTAQRRMAQKKPAWELRRRILHVPYVLYHWRCHTASTADNTASKSYAYEAGRRALECFCAGRGWHVKVEHSLHLGFYEITYLPDILAVREDVGVAGGRILDARGRICAGAMDEGGNCLFEGLYKEYSGGNSHPASLKQDVCAVDIRCMQVRPELWETFEQITGLPYAERSVRGIVGGSGRKGTGKKIRIADVTGLSCDEAGYRKLSMELGKAAAEHGYLVVWDPGISCRADV